jgi:hypothetical protein
VTNSGTLGVSNTATLTVHNLGPSSGTLAISNGTLNLAGSLTQAGLGTIVRSGGTVNLTGLLAGNLDLNAASGSFSLLGGTISGGTLSALGASLRLSGNGGLLNNVTANADLDLSAPNSLLSLTGSITLNGLTTIGNNARLVMNGASQALAGTGILVFQNETTQAILMNVNGATLTVGPGLLIHGGGSNSGFSGGIGYSQWYGGGSNLTIINNGTISADTAGGYILLNPNGGTIVNNGTLEAKNGGQFVTSALTNNGTVSIVNSTFTLLTGAWSNAGTIMATNSVLNLGGSFSQAALGTFVRTGGTVNLTGTLSGNLNLNAGTGSWNLLGGTLTGGHLSAAGGHTLASTPSGGTLIGMIVHANLDLTTPNSYITVRSGMTLNSTITLGSSSRLAFEGNTTLAGNGTIVLENQPFNALTLSQNSTTLTIGSGISIRGGANAANSANIGYSAWYGGGGTLTLVNQGTLHSDTPGNAITINPNGGSFTSSGPLLGPGGFGFGSGFSVINGTLGTPGTITLTAATLTLQTAAPVTGRIAGTGTLVVAAGTALISDGIAVDTLSIAGTHLIRANGSNAGATRVSALLFAGTPGAWTGQLDLTNNALIVQGNSTNKATLLSTLNSYIASGSHGGLWDGPGITSSTLLAAPSHALALADNADLGLNSYRGLFLNENAFIVLQARIGDATLDGRVDAFDLNKLAAHWQQPGGASWSAGDFTNDGIVDAFDLNALAANWQYGVGGGLETFDTALARFPDIAAAVPEPASVLLLAAGAIPLLSRRRGRERNPSSVPG